MSGLTKYSVNVSPTDLFNGVCEMIIFNNGRISFKIMVFVGLNTTLCFETPPQLKMFTISLEIPTRFPTVNLQYKNANKLTI